MLDLAKFKAFSGNKLNVSQKLKVMLESVENIVGKEEMLVTSIFSFFVKLSCSEQDIVITMTVRVSEFVQTITSRIVDGFQMILHNCSPSRVDVPFETFV